MVYEQQLYPVNPASLAEISGATKIRRFAAPTPPVVRPFLLTSQLRGCACAGGLALPPDYGILRGLGQDYTGDPGTDININNLAVPSRGTGNISVLQTAAAGANFIPGIGQIASIAISTLHGLLDQFEAWFHIGAGRREADLIVPIQNNIVNQHLGPITQQILTGQNPSVNTLQGLYRQVWSLAVGFQEFVLLRNFTDRRASGQALNTVMPYIDGTCGYAVPAGFTETPSRSNCLSWGDGTVGGVGTNGMLGAIGRAITAAGGSIPALPDVHQAANQGIKPTQITTGPIGLPSLPPTIMGVSTPLALLIGVGALFLYKRGLK